MRNFYAFLSQVLKDWFTGLDNHHYELGRFLWFAAVVAAIVYPGAAMYFNHQEFDVQAFCIGLAAILAAGGFGVAQKDSARPEPVKPALTGEGE